MGFVILISISGVGPKLAVNILSHIPVQELKRAIASGDIKRLQNGLASDEKEQLGHQVEALQSLSKREQQLGVMRASKRLQANLPPAPKEGIESMPDVLSSQFAIATSALVTGLQFR